MTREDPYRQTVQTGLAPFLNEVGEGPEWHELAQPSNHLRTTKQRIVPAWAAASLAAVGVIAILGLTTLLMRGTPVTTADPVTPQATILPPTTQVGTTLPAQDTTTPPIDPNSPWMPLPTTTLDHRDGHSIVWTGQRLLIWGGADNPGGSDPFTNDGAAYIPETGDWESLSAAPISSRTWHSAVFTGSEMIIWGGFGDTDITDGAAYNPTSNTWRSIASPPIASRWLGHSTTWTGTEMIIWGAVLDDQKEPLGAAYNPETDTWRTLPQGPLENRAGHTAVWTGQDMIIWGGETTSPDTSSEYLNTGAAYNPALDTWRMLAPSPINPRWHHTAVWSDESMIIWGGAADDATGAALADGAAYDPTNDTWTVLPESPLSARYEHASHWTAQGMLIWGGHIRTSGSTWEQYADGAAFDPTDQSWTIMPAAPVAGTRYTTPSAWTGDQLIYWGRGDDFQVSGGAGLTP